ncbi:MAG TPA: TIR domain-containing protein [Actinomycetota bacterium]|nr:TIR domain-containing protein [Actinomycetota bacterium]
MKRQEFRIFISYRREDTSGHAGRLYDALSGPFGERAVFMDIDTIEPGEDFVEIVRNAVAASDVLVTLIGARWSSVLDPEGRRRLDNPEDFVRVELRTALERGIRVIPVLVQGAKMPSARSVPDDIKALLRRNAIEVSDQRWRFDTQRLIDLLARLKRERDQGKGGLDLAGHLGTDPGGRAIRVPRRKQIAPDRRGRSEERPVIHVRDREGVPAGPPGPLRTGARWLLRHRLGVIVIVLALAAAGTAWFLSVGHGALGTGGQCTETPRSEVRIQLLDGTGEPQGSSVAAAWATDLRESGFEQTNGSVDTFRFLRSTIYSRDGFGCAADVVAGLLGSQEPIEVIPVSDPPHSLSGVEPTEDLWIVVGLDALPGAKSP